MTESSHVAAELKDRNRGSIDQWLFSGYDDKQYESPRPKSRVGVDQDAAEYAARNRGQMSEIMAMPEDGAMEASPKHRPPRKTGPVTPRCPTAESRQNAEKNEGAGMKSIFGTDGESPTHKNKTRIRPEALENAQKHKGSLDMDMHNHTDGFQGKPRVRPEGSAYAERNKGSLTQQQYHYGEHADKPATPRRMHGEAEINAKRSEGAGVKEVFHMATD